MITIVDYGLGNLGSVFNMFKKIGVKSEVTSDLEKIAKAEKILLPGVGAFDTAMKKIHATNLLPILNKKALEEKVPVLGICLGMQLLTNSSEEGKLPGLGWIRGKTIAFNGCIPTGLRIPHMGWNIVRFSGDNAMSKNFNEEARFYFVHSYFVKVDDERNSMMKTSYGVEFDSGICKDNIFGAQFHPEKSHKFGMQLFSNFAKL